MSLKELQDYYNTLCEAHKYLINKTKKPRSRQLEVILSTLKAEIYNCERLIIQKTKQERSEVVL